MKYFTNELWTQMNQGNAHEAEKAHNEWSENKKIKKLELRFESGENEFDQRRGFDDWGYNEILSVDDETLSFEVLFASGATVLVYFKNKQLFLKKQ